MGRSSSGSLRLQNLVSFLFPFLLLLGHFFICFCSHARAFMELCSTACIEDIVQHDRSALASQQDLSEPGFSPDLVGRVVNHYRTLLCTRPCQSLARGRVGVRLLAREADRLCGPLLEGLERPLLLPEFFVLLKFLTYCAHVGPTTKPEAALLRPHSLRDALVPNVIQRHGLASETDLDFAPIVIPREAYVHGLVQVSEEVDEHLYRVCIGELYALLNFVVIDGREVDPPALVLQDLAEEVLDGLDEADVVLALRSTSLGRPTKRLGAVIVHLKM
mmetsp:Transcript_119920/g.334551  ORF Transcript_119920/g.334551 Transcript_119920/m.334551 type:complete len:275 (+) Transcript_119920:291-1115(+)